MLAVWLQITLHFVQFILINQSAGFVDLGVEAGRSVTSMMFVRHVYSKERVYYDGSNTK